MQGRKGERLFGREMNGPGRSGIALDAGCEGCGFTIIVMSSSSSFSHLSLGRYCDFVFVVL